LGLLNCSISTWKSSAISKPRCCLGSVALAYLWAQLLQRKKTVYPSSAPRSCSSLNSVAELLHTGHASDVVAYVSTWLWSRAWTLTRLARRLEGNATALEMVWDDGGHLCWVGVVSILMSFVGERGETYLDSAFGNAVTSAAARGRYLYSARGNAGRRFSGPRVRRGRAGRRRLCRRVGCRLGTWLWGRE
jgi:hypothetical protein